MRIKCSLVFICLFQICVTHAQAAKISDSAKFNRLLRENLHAFTFDGKVASGEGWAILEKQFAQSQFVAWGEYHNSPLLSQLFSYALESASKYGFRNWCAEVSPFVASELMQIAKNTNPYDELAKVSSDHPDNGTFPFFKTKEDAQMLAATERFRYNIWGLDQEFQLAFPYAISKVYNAQSPAVKKMYKPVHDSLLAVWWMPKVKLLDSLKKVTTQEELRNVLDDIKISRTIYYNSDNQMRATLMKRNFYRYYDNAKSNHEKVLFKLGANHLAKGLNLGTRIYDMGNAISELAERNNTLFSNNFFMVRYTTNKGKLIDDLENPDNDYPRELMKLYDKDKWIVADLRPLRIYYQNDKTLSDDIYQLIYKYDFAVISPELMK